MKHFIKWLAIASASILILFGFGFYIWSQQTYGPSEELLDQVDMVSIMDGDYVVIRATGEVKAGVIFYPGAKVENTAYSYYAKNLAEAGYDVFIPSMTLNFPLLDKGISGKIISDNPVIKRWYVGGHSLGGVAAAMFVKEHEHLVNGLILFASYPSGGSDLSASDLDVLSLYAERDGLTTVQDIEASKQLLPTSARFVEVKGGNHAQFGLYGEQKGDQQATISALEQQQFIINETVQWLHSLY